MEDNVVSMHQNDPSENNEEMNKGFLEPDVDKSTPHQEEIPQTKNEVPKRSKTKDPIDAVLDSVFGQDYTPLFNAYKDVITALDSNVEYLKNQLDIVKKNYKKIAIIATTALSIALIAILKKRK